MINLAKTQREKPLEKENWKGYYQKLCLNCKNHEIIVKHGIAEWLFFHCKYLHEDLAMMYLTFDLKSKSCHGWKWIMEVT